MSDSKWYNLSDGSFLRACWARLPWRNSWACGVARVLPVAIMLFGTSAMSHAQKKEIAQARDNVKAGKNLTETENSMRKLLANPANRSNEKIWLVLFDAVRKQYEAVNEQMYLKKTVDTAQLFAANIRMFQTLESLDSVDAMPDSKGRVKLKYRKRNSEYLNSFRTNLYNGGLFHTAKKNYAKAFDCFAAYVDCARQPLFAAYNYSANDSRMPRAAFNAVYNGYMSGSAEKTLRYAAVAQHDTVRLDLTLKYMAEAYRQQKDTANNVECLVKGFALYPRDKYFFSNLFDYYFKRGDMRQAIAVVDGVVKVDSNNVAALFARSAVLMAQKNYGECIKVCDKIIALDSCHAGACLNAGLSYYNRAVELDVARDRTREDRTRMLDLYRRALPYMRKYRELSPGDTSVWAKPLYTIYLNLNMGKEFDEIDSILRKKK